jgi:hypothetical protein
MLRTSRTSCKKEYGSSVAFFSFFLPCSLCSAAVKKEKPLAPPLLAPVPPFFREGLADLEVDLLLLFLGCASSISVPLSGTMKESSSESAAVDERREDTEEADEERRWEVGMDESDGMRSSSSLA